MSQDRRFLALFIVAVLAIVVFLVEEGVILAENTPKNVKEGDVRGIASWYGYEEGLITANGEVFNPDANTCASWDYSFGTILRVTNLDNKKLTYCRVNDRGPSKRFSDRKIDLTRKTFSQISDLTKGLVRVKIEPCLNDACSVRKNSKVSER